MRPPLMPMLRLVVLMSGLTAGCQVYLAGGPGETAITDSGTRHSLPLAPLSSTAAAAAMTSAPPSTTPATVPMAMAPATTVAAPASARHQIHPPGGAPFPGERYYRAGRTHVVVAAVEDALVTRGFRVLRSGTNTRGGEVHAERRERLAAPPRTSSSPAWKVQTAVIRIAGATWTDCCYVRAAFTTTSLNSRGDLLGTTSADEPENHVIRGWFFDDVTRRLPATPAVWSPLHQ